MKKITLLAMSFLMALAVNAQQAGKDVTSLFENTDFETGDNSGWTYDDNGLAAGHNNPNNEPAGKHNHQGLHFMEAWCHSGGNLGDFDWSQTQDVPNGYYVVKALAHAIKQNQTVTPEPHGVFVYAEDKQVEVTTTTGAEYVVFAKVTDEALTMGFRGVNVDVNWVACDYFRAIQCFGDTEEEAKISWMKYEVEALALAFEEVLELPMSQALKDAIEESIAAIDTISSYAAGNALFETMKQQKADADACVVAYEQLTLKIDEVYNFADEEGADELYEAADIATEKYEEGSLDAAGALAEIEALNDAIFAYNLSIADGTTGFDVTDLFVTNPTWREKNNMKGWDVNVVRKMDWGSFPAWGNDLAEVYQSDFNISQTLTNVPNGKYKVRVQAFYRGAQETAYLFANNAEVKLLRLDKYTTSDFGSLGGKFTDAGLADDLTSASNVFNTQNPNTGRNFYDENELEVIVMDSTLTFGIRSTTPEMGTWCAFRDFQLYYYGNYPSVNLYGKSETIKDYMAKNISTIPYAVNTEITNYLRDIRDYTVDGKYSDEEVNVVILQLDSVWAEALKAIDLFADLKLVAEKIEKELLPLGYPGKDSLNAALESMEPYFAETSTVNTYANMQALKAEIETAIYDYHMSQAATPEAGANYTFLIPNANFEEKGNWTWSMNAGGTDMWIGNCRPLVLDGASRRGINLWGWGITSVDVHQVLTGLPDGVYKVSAEMITQNDYATDQHVYATGASKVTSENLNVEGWDSCRWTELTTTDCAVVIGGELRIGAESSQGGTNSEGWFQATNFKLYYHGEASAEQLKAAWENTQARANEAIEILIPNEKKELVAAMEQAMALAAEEKYSEACVLITPMVNALDSTVRVSKAFFDSYYARLDTLRLRPGYEGCEDTHAFADAVVALTDEILTSDTATCKLFDDLNSKLQAYSGYASSLRDAENAVNDTVNQYLEKYERFVMDSVVAPQVDTLLYKLRKVEYCNELRAVLDEAVKLLKGTANASLDVKEGDVTYLIVNPTCDIEEDDANNVPGWTWVKGNGDKATHDAEHYDANVNEKKEARFLNSWAEGLNSTFYQEIMGLPDGTYRLTVAARTNGNNAYIFAATTTSGINNDTTVMQEIKNYNNVRGEIWSADSLEWVKAGSPEENLMENFPYFMANVPQNDSIATMYGVGYGWSWHVLDTIQVTNHFLSIGFSADKAQTGKSAFTGSWMSADDWKLELIEISEVQSEFDPFAGFNTKIEPEDTPEDNSVGNIEVEAPVIVVRDGSIYSSTGAPVVVYTIDGKRVADTGLSRGIYIVRCQNTVAKVVVR